ncbi:MAG: MBL fold metallo-hydrolase [Sedimentisphaerales bacterium]|nr:MBL fold metallo-hydrolase [Sedimentisphaerales bacterium]
MIEITFLGTGTSQGIPIINCACPVCRSEDPRDQRLRTSALITLDGHNILIDASPELRLQCLQNDVRHLDAVLLTHTHADHIFGLDDLRRFTQSQARPLDIYAGTDHLPALEKIFGYARYDRSNGNHDLPHLNFNPIDGPFELFSHQIIPHSMPHGRFNVLGYRIGPLAYCTDISAMSDQIVADLQGLRILVLGALRPWPHPAHLSIDQAVDLAHRINAEQTYLVHMSHHIGHQQTQKSLPKGIQLAWDGLKISLEE